ncbi:hypothetical protein BJ875DRAFT_524440 [Amylocarpus encephaloides]|uniref:RING-type domain-containing protein n=1 Tax=Amylocarpus encephaloides TaxID=45428 RepID=A0A9P8C0N6_9HELO|nr:hypothetical protein BJ875DRAFT_524440 [Amylocarpus encephaloides]
MTAPTSPQCPICMENIINTSTTQCGHSFCDECISLWIDASNDFFKLLGCPVCRKVITTLYYTDNLEEDKPVDDDHEMSEDHFNNYLEDLTYSDDDNNPVSFNSDDGERK